MSVSPPTHAVKIIPPRSPRQPPFKSLPGEASAEPVASTHAAAINFFTFPIELCTPSSS